MPTRRAALQWLAAYGGAALAAGVGCRTGVPDAGACPALAGQRIRWIVPNAAGGGYDTESRLLQPFLEERLAAPIVVENQAGAGGLIGVRAIAEARPDGRTLGMMGVPGVAVARLLGQQAAPDPANDFTILGRISRSMHVWAAGADRPIASLEAAVERARTQPLVFPLNEVASLDFIAINVPATLLRVPVNIVAGFEGTRAMCLAAIRGDVDLVTGNLESIRPFLTSGELRPLLQISSSPLDDGSLFRDVPLLGGREGHAVRAAVTAGSDSEQSLEIAESLIRLIGAGRVVVAPRGLPDDLAACLGDVLADVLASDRLRAAAKTALDPAPAAAARSDTASISADARRLLPIIEPALQKLRG